MPGTITALFEALDRAADLFEAAALVGYPSSTYAAQGLRERKASLQRRLAKGDPLEITARLLDIVPNAKDLDAIGFDAKKHPEISRLLAEIDDLAAEISFDYLPDD